MKREEMVATVLAAAVLVALSFAEPAAAGRNRPSFCPASGGSGYVWLLAYAGATQVANVLQGLPAGEDGATQLLDLGPHLEGEAALRFDCKPGLSGPELRVRNVYGSAIQGALVLGIDVQPMLGGQDGHAEFQVEFADEGGGGLNQPIQYTTFFTEDDNQSSPNVVSGLSYATTITSENPQTFSAGPVTIPGPAVGSAFVEFAVQLSFTLGPGDSLVMRGSSALPNPPPPVCADGFDNDGDGFVDFGADPGCDVAADDWEHSVDLECDDGIDNDGDGFWDFRADLDGNGIADPPGDPGCFSPTYFENPRCQDGIDNDLQTGTDFDGGLSALGPGGVDPNGPDPNCDSPYDNFEGPPRCGLGFELVGLLPPLMALRRRRRRVAARS